MNEEEMREYITKLEKEKEELKQNSDYVSSKNEELTKALEERENEVKNLKLKNYELFVQIPHEYNQPSNNDNNENNNVIPINDLINNLKEGK